MKAQDKICRQIVLASLHLAKFKDVDSYLNEWTNQSSTTIKAQLFRSNYWKACLGAFNPTPSLIFFHHVRRSLPLSSNRDSNPRLYNLSPLTLPILSSHCSMAQWLNRMRVLCYRIFKRHFLHHEQGFLFKLEMHPNLIFHLRCCNKVEKAWGHINNSILQQGAHSQLSASLQDSTSVVWLVL